MNNRSEILLRRMLKNSVSRQPPPENGRARLLWEVALERRNKVDLPMRFYHPQIKNYPSTTIIDWPQTLFAWINENSLQVGFQARLG